MASTAVDPVRDPRQKNRQPMSSKRRSEFELNQLNPDPDTALVYKNFNFYLLSMLE